MKPNSFYNAEKSFYAYLVKTFMVALYNEVLSFESVYELL